MATTKKLMGTTAVGGALAIEDVFSTYLYTGNGSTQTITNGIDLAGEGGMVWFKIRNGTWYHNIADTERGPTKYIYPNVSDRDDTITTRITSFNSDGFSLSNNATVNASSSTYASWTFRKAPRFFDVVTYTGDGVAGREIAHNLGCEVGTIIVKCTSNAESWPVWHKDGNGAGSPSVGQLESTAAFNTGNYPYLFGNGSVGIPPTSSVFTVYNGNAVNRLGRTYVAYLFAHDPLGESGDGSDGLIACGSYTGGGSSNVDINLGWEAQWVMIKRTDAAGYDWIMLDTMRGIPTGGGNSWLRANGSDAEALASEYINVTATGFKTVANNNNTNGSGATYIYIAIRRGPMRQPESGTEVFQPLSEVGTGASRTVDAGFPVDTFFIKDRTGLTGPTAGGNVFYDRLRGNSNLLQTQSTAAEAVSATYTALFNSVQNGVVLSVTWSAYGYREYCFRRAPGFFDVVAYTGDGVAGRTVPHNLGVAPELMIVKRRSSASGWNIYHSFNTATKKHYFSTGASFSSSDTWNNTEPSDAVFTLGTNIEVNGSGSTYVAYLFATLPGVSKVGSYTGNGTSQTINCGFTSGARFILIKRTDSTGDWYVWDTARGIVAANDPHLSLNTTAAEVTTDDSVDPDNSGFIVNQVAATNINVSSASYIFYAVS